MPRWFFLTPIWFILTSTWFILRTCSSSSCPCASSLHLCGSSSCPGGSSSLQCSSSLCLFGSARPCGSSLCPCGSTSRPCGYSSCPCGSSSCLCGSSSRVALLQLNFSRMMMDWLTNIENITSCYCFWRWFCMVLRYIEYLLHVYRSWGPTNYFSAFEKFKEVMPPPMSTCTHMPPYTQT